jgi:IS30 family transposase
MQSRTKFTRTTTIQIQRWLDEGLSADQIAARIGCTVGTLRVKCSQFGISLRCRKRNYHRANTNATRAVRKRSSEPRERLILSVRRGTLDRLRTHASSKGVSAPKLAASLLEKIAQDDLYKAVPDDN